MGLVFGSGVLESVVVDVVDELRGVAIEDPTLAFDFVRPFEVVCGGFESGEVDQGVSEGNFFVFEEEMDRCVDFQELVEF